MQLPGTAQAATRVLRQPIESQGRTFAVTAVSMGNPHAVIFVEDPSTDLRALAETFGPGLEVHPFFPRRTNVEFARVRTGASGPEIDLVVWERGCGITLACGTGACATVVAACLEGRTQPGRETHVHLPGGPLFITVQTGAPGDATSAVSASPYSMVTMRGPARFVFEAEVDPGAVRP
jgi:diaminopimelate epimerase